MSKLDGVVFSLSLSLWQRNVLELFRDIFKKKHISVSKVHKPNFYVTLFFCTFAFILVPVLYFVVFRLWCKAEPCDLHSIVQSTEHPPHLSLSLDINNVLPLWACTIRVSPFTITLTHNPQCTKQAQETKKKQWKTKTGSAWEKRLMTDFSTEQKAIWKQSLCGGIWSI